MLLLYQKKNISHQQKNVKNKIEKDKKESIILHQLSLKKGIQHQKPHLKKVIFHGKLGKQLKKIVESPLEISITIGKMESLQKIN